MEEKVKVDYVGENGETRFHELKAETLRCPYCHAFVMPNFHFSAKKDNNVWNVFCGCTNPKCKNSFVVEYEYDNQYVLSFKRVQPTPPLQQRIFDDAILHISSSFVEIYNQAFSAFQLGLSQICGIGFRKSIEYLIKDYAMLMFPCQSDTIKTKKLAQCINDYITDTRIKEVAKRAVWLGNDEAHYYRKWENKDVNDLMDTIDLTLYWIEAEEKSKRLLAEISK